MLSDDFSSVSCDSPAQSPRPARRVKPGLDMSPAEWASLSRFGCGEWIPEGQIDRLERLGLIEKVFGQPLLTRLGRTTLGLGS